MQVVILFSAEVGHDADDPEGYRTGYARLGPQLGASMLGASIYALPPAQSICQYHYEYGNEEWLLVLEGTATLRHPEGAVYPDSDKIGAWSGNERDRIMVRRASATDYWDGEI